MPQMTKAELLEERKAMLEELAAIREKISDFLGDSEEGEDEDEEAE